MGETNSQKDYSKVDRVGKMFEESESNKYGRYVVSVFVQNFGRFLLLFVS